MKNPIQKPSNSRSSRRFANAFYLVVPLVAIALFFSRSASGPDTAQGPGSSSPARILASGNSPFAAFRGPSRKAPKQLAEKMLTLPPNDSAQTVVLVGALLRSNNADGVATWIKSLSTQEQRQQPGAAALRGISQS